MTKNCYICKTVWSLVEHQAHFFDYDLGNLFYAKKGIFFLSVKILKTFDISYIKIVDFGIIIVV